MFLEIHGHQEFNHRPALLFCAWDCALLRKLQFHPLAVRLRNAAIALGACLDGFLHEPY